jgi:RNA-directed DNA polymerase
MSAPQNRQPTRAELIERIRTSSKEAVVLAEMQRLGFWPNDAAKPSLESALIQREAELVKTLDGLHADLRQKGDPKTAMKLMRKERMQRARERREVTAQALEKTRFEKATAWHAARDQQAGYLGAGASGGLRPEADPARLHARLAAQNLPLIDDAAALAKAVGISVPELKFLCFHREVASTTHYRRFALSKKSGGERIISAPMPRLKRAQYWLLDNVLAKVNCHSAAHGFVNGKSIVTNAAPHCGKAVVINLDLKNFFPSIAYPRVKGVFQALGYGEAVASQFALLCSENVADELQIDGERFYVGGKARDRVLPQGAPTSPMLTNILCRRLDKRLQGIAAKLGFVYTRYADDLTFSAEKPAESLTGRLLRQVHFVLKDEGFTPHPDKQHIMRSSQRQEVTGVVVNGAPGVARTERRRLRAALHLAQTKGTQQANWKGAPATKNVLLGYAHFVNMVSPTQGASLLKAARGLGADASQHAASKAVPSAFRAQSAKGQAPTRKAGAWWQPAAKPAPKLLRTAGQMKAERQARLNSERAARNAEKNAVRDGERAAAAAARVQQQTARNEEAAHAVEVLARYKSPVPWWTFALQAMIVLQLAFRLKSAPIFMLGSFWLAYLLIKRKFGWLHYLIGLGVIVGAAMLVKIL